MLKRLLTLSAILFFVNVLYAQESKTDTVYFDTSIHCEKCKDTMFDNLPHVNGVMDLDVDVPTKIVAVTFNTGETTIAKLAGKINELGYSAFIIPKDKLEEHKEKKMKLNKGHHEMQ